MATCPNINLDSWKNLVAARGEDLAYYLWDRYDGNVPESESKSEIVKAGLKATNALQSDKGIQLFNTLAKNKVTGDAFWNKIQSDLQIPKDQMELLKKYEITDREQLITNMLADYSFAIEINLGRALVSRQTRYFQDENQMLEEDIDTPYNRAILQPDGRYKVILVASDGSEFSPGIFTREEAIEDFGESIFEGQKSLPKSDYYSNLTVPGGTNYTENELATPAITPSIKGHAQFATDKGIGWFRSDDKSLRKELTTYTKEGDRYFMQKESEGKKEITEDFYNRILNEVKQSKTRRILELQSDLFQKGRDRSTLIFDQNTKFEKSSKEEYEKAKQFGKKENTEESGVIAYNYNDNLYIHDPEEGSYSVRKDFERRNEKENQFLQLLNKSNNWVTFFVKSIIQDSAKKGYEKVVFPTGATAYKIESGGNTIEDFIKVKEDRIKQLSGYYVVTDSSNSIFYRTDSKEDAEDYAKKKENYKVISSVELKANKTEIEQLQREIKNAKEGASGLAATAKFYEETVANVLRKQGYNPKQITDEYGNTWNEIEVVPERESAKILFQLEEMPASKASEETLNKVKQVLEKMGVKTQALTDYAKAHPEIDVTSAAGVADLVRGVIAVAEGKEDVALTEEMVHIATAILEQTNPKMVTEMISKIERFKIYKQVLEAYKNNKAYQLPNGKPDIRKIKKEAVDKLIAELIINQSEGSTEFPELMEEADRSLVRRWWNAITDFLRGMYKKSNISIFEEAATTISEGQVEGTVSEIKEQGVFFQLTDKQTETINKIKAQQKNIEKIIEDKKEADPLLMDSEEANNYYRIKLPDGTYIEKSAIKRVTDRVKAWYKQRFGDKTFTEAEKKFNNLKREYGIKYHGYFDEIHARYYNNDGSKRDTAGDRPYISDPIDADVYNKIEKYYTDLINLPELKDAAILTEVMIYDPKEKEAGTIDFLAIDKNGKAHILDWKFMYVADESKTDDVAWFKQGAYNIQLGRYKQMLRDAYGIKEFGMTRAIPFLMRFQRENPKDSKSPMILKGIVAGSADKTKIENLKLMPVAEEAESTGFEELDKLIRQLNAILKQYASQKVTDETEREFKIERMNTIRRAIRIVQGSQNIAPLIDVIEVMRKDGEKILEDYNTTYKDRPATRQDSEDRDLSDFSDEMRNYIQFSELFTEVGDYIGDLIYTENMAKEAKTKDEKEYASQMKEVLSRLESEQTAIRKSRKKIQDAANKFADKHIGQRNLVTGLTKPEAVVQGLSSWFRGVSELPMASLKVLYKLVTLAKGKASAEALEEVKELMAIRDKIAKSGRDLRTTVKQIYQADDKGGLVNKLVYKYKKEFYDLIKEKKEEGGDKKWLLENINIEEYKKEANAKMEENIEKIKKRRYPGTKEEEEETRAELILDEKKRWDITRKDFNGWDNYILKRHPKDEWFSNDYKKIKADPELLELYNFITKFNQKAKEVGYIENKIASTFLPFVRKSMAESLAWDGSLSAIQNFSNNLTLKADDVGYGKFNELTGELENSIPKYYTYDFTVKSDGVNDYSEVSEDLFKNLILYVQHVNKYKYMSDIEGQLQLVKTIEEFKGNLNTNRIGDVIKKDNKLQETPNNENNTKTFNVFLRALLYEQKYALSDADTPLYFSKTLNGVKKLVNKVAGKEIWKEDENPSATSLIKTMDAANRAFQLKTLGLNPISGAVNMFGANIQISTQAGRYFKSREFLKNEKKLLGMDFVNNEERELFTQTVDLFMPLKDDPSYELYKKAGMSIATRRSASDDLMFFMRYPEQLVEKAVFETLMENMMVENGYIVSIQNFVKNKYKGRTKDAAKYRETKEKIEKEIEELKNTRSIAKTRKLENGKLVIPGLDLKNREELQRLTNLTRNISRNATGGIADGDINKASMSIWGRSAMVFRNWIPKLTDTRFSEFRKISDDFSVTINEDGELEGERYDIGRIRLLGHVFMNSFSQASNNFRNILEMNEAGIAEIDRMYEEYAKAYEDRTGEKMTMDRDEFAEMVRTNLRNQLKELAILASLVGTMFALGFVAPDDDEDKATKNAFRYTQRVVDKFVGELSFFYNPVNWEQVLSGSAFPAIGLISDFYKVMSNFFMETTGFDFTDPTKTPEEIRKQAMPVKRVINMVPAGRTFMTWLAMIDSEFAKEFDITVQKESNIR